jgi:hypothetical protein
MIAVQMPSAIPNPPSIPSNAPEHCPVSTHLMAIHGRSDHEIRRELNQNSQGKQTPALDVRIKKYVLLQSRKDLIPLFHSYASGWLA